MPDRAPAASPPDAPSGTPATVPVGPLAFDAVGVTIGAATILRAITMSLHPGELCALIGPSGAGKSTLIRVLLGLRPASSGRVTLGGRPTHEAGAIGYVPQRDVLHRTLTVRATLDYAALLRLPRLGDRGRAALIEQVAREVGLGERLDLAVGKLSGGQQKRVSVALELLTRPPVLVLDEPTSGLDPGLEKRMTALFAEVAREGRIVLVATHAMQSLHRCHAVALLVGGCLAYFGPPGEAPAYFRAPSHGAIFDVLPKQKPAAWAKQYLKSDVRQRFTSRPAPALPRSPELRALASAGASAPGSPA